MVSLQNNIGKTDSDDENLGIQTVLVEQLQLSDSDDFNASLLPMLRLSHVGNHQRRNADNQGLAVSAMQAPSTTPAVTRNVPKGQASEWSETLASGFRRVTRAIPEGLDRKSRKLLLAQYDIIDRDRLKMKAQATTDAERATLKGNVERAQGIVSEIVESVRNK